jgi:hypothetical protein
MILVLGSGTSGVPSQDDKGGRPKMVLLGLLGYTRWWPSRGRRIAPWMSR